MPCQYKSEGSGRLSDDLHLSISPLVLSYCLSLALFLSRSHPLSLSLFVSMCFFFRFPTNTNLYFPLPFRQHFDSVNRARDTLPSDPHRSLRPWTWGIRALVRGGRGPCSKAQRDTLVIDLTLRSMQDFNIISYFSEGLSLVERISVPVTISVPKLAKASFSTTSFTDVSPISVSA